MEKFKNKKVPKASLCSSLGSGETALRYYTPMGELAVYNIRYIAGISPARSGDLDEAQRFNVLLTNHGCLPTAHSVEELQALLYPVQVDDD